MNKLEKYLKHSGLIQRVFAKKIGISPNHLVTILKGRSQPSLPLAYRIELMTGGLVTMYDWLTDEDKKMPEEKLEE